MKKILVPVDGSESSARAVKVAIEATKLVEGTSIVLLTVQPPIVSGNVRRFFSAEAIEDFYRSEGTTALMTAKTLLTEAGVPFEEHIEVGPVAQTIADCVSEYQCDLIIMGSRGHGSVAGMVLGSVATKVVSLVHVPVTLVK